MSDSVDPALETRKRGRARGRRAECARVLRHDLRSRLPSHRRERCMRSPLTWTFPPRVSTSRSCR